MKLGFDEVYVITKDNIIIEYECLYDSISADNEVERLRAIGHITARKLTLEYAYENGFTNIQRAGL
jgi:hypothetical protein